MHFCLDVKIRKENFAIDIIDISNYLSDKRACSQCLCYPKELDIFRSSSTVARKRNEPPKKKNQFCLMIPGICFLDV